MRIGQNTQPEVVSLLNPIKDIRGLAINVAKEPLIEKTTKIKNKSKFEVIPHRCFNLFIIIFYIKSWAKVIKIIQSLEL